MVAQFSSGILAQFLINIYIYVSVCERTGIALTVLSVSFVRVVKNTFNEVSPTGGAFT
jgi:hypothetical protein